jgi:replicative DNA helicase
MDKPQTETPKFVPQEQARVRWLKSLKQQDGKRYFKSGFVKHDQTAGALLRGALYLVAARAGIGKTAFLFSLAYRQIRGGVKAYYCNLEMSVEQMWHRLACLHDADLTLREINEGELTPQRISYFHHLSQEL